MRHLVGLGSDVDELFTARPSDQQIRWTSFNLSHERKTPTKQGKQTSRRYCKRHFQKFCITGSKCLHAAQGHLHDLSCNSRVVHVALSFSIAVQPNPSDVRMLDGVYAKDGSKKDASCCVNESADICGDHSQTTSGLTVSNFLSSNVAFQRLLNNLASASGRIRIACTEIETSYLVQCRWHGRRGDRDFTCPRGGYIFFF